jgi:hypothetical protein
MELLMVLWITIMLATMLLDAIDFSIKKYVYSNKGFMTSSKYTAHVERNYELFKKAISELVNRSNLTNEEADRNYLYIKARLYHIDPERFENNIDALEREINSIELDERKLVESIRNPYYSKGN